MTVSSAANGAHPTHLPLFGLVALATTSFVSILTEALPAGLLPQISRGLDVSEAAAGQVVTIYSIASLLVAIPVTVMTQGFRRKPLLLVAIAGFALGNTVTSISNDYAFTMAARFCAGAGAGLLWALLPGYASRMAPANLRGRAIAIAMVGISIAMSIGVPAGTFLGIAIGWRSVFSLLSLIALALIAWITFGVPDFPGMPATRRMTVGQVFANAGVRAVMMLTFAFVLAHNILYTYIAPFVAPAGLGERVDLVLLVFGFAGLAGIWITGMLVDRWLRPLILASSVIFATASLALGLAGRDPTIVFLSVAAWGLAFGGCATLFQTALAIVAGDGADVAQSLLVVTWNCAISGGGVIGGLLLTRSGVAAFPWTLLPLLLVSFVVAARTRRF